MTWRNKGKTTERGYGWEWQQIRQFILRRDRYLCQICKLRTANEVDHIIEKAKGGTDAPDNLQALCHSCHKAKTYDRGKPKKRTLDKSWHQMIDDLREQSRGQTPYTDSDE